jgi:hypothetical protein
MVNKLSTLAGFLEDQSIPLWVKDALREKRDVILQTLQSGQSYTLEGPAGEKITITPELVAA